MAKMLASLVVFVSVFSLLFFASSAVEFLETLHLDNAANSRFEHRFRDEDYQFTVSDRTLTKKDNNGSIVLYESDYRINQDIKVDSKTGTVYFYDGWEDNGKIVSCRLKDSICQITEVTGGLNLFTYSEDAYIALRYITGMHGPIASKIFELQKDGTISAEFEYENIGMDRIITEQKSGNVVVNVSFHEEYQIYYKGSYYQDPYLLGAHWWSDGILVNASLPIINSINLCSLFSKFGQNWICVRKKVGSIYESFFCCRAHVQESIFLRSATVPIVDNDRIVYEDLDQQLVSVQLLSSK